MDKEKYDALLKTAGKAVPDFDDIIDVYDTEIVFVSKKLAAFVGYKPEELVGKSVSLVFDKDKLQKESKPKVITIESGEITNSLRTKNNKPVKTRTKFKVIKFEDTPYYVGKVLEYIK